MKHFNFANEIRSTRINYEIWQSSNVFAIFCTRITVWKIKTIRVVAKFEYFREIYHWSKFFKRCINIQEYSIKLKNTATKWLCKHSRQSRDNIWRINYWFTLANLRLAYQAQSSDYKISYTCLMDELNLEFWFKVGFIELDRIQDWDGSTLSQSISCSGYNGYSALKLVHIIWIQTMVFSYALPIKRMVK